MEEQTEVTLRCRECRRLRPGDTPTAIGRLLRTPEGRWQAYRMERSPVPREPIQLGINSWLDDPRYGLAGEDGTLGSLWVYPIMLRRDIRIDVFSCRWCLRPPFRVPRARTGARALAQGLAEVDV
jgi:hypothetical protein